MRTSATALLGAALVAAAACGGPGREPPGGLPDAGDPDPPFELPPCWEPATDALQPARIQPPAAGSGAFEDLGAPAASALRRSVEAYLAGDPEAALGAARAATYELCQDQGLVRWAPFASGSGQALLVLREEATVPLLLEAPHPFYDLGTLDQAREGFETHDLRGVLVSGSHRCASDTPSACDGTTTVCGGGDQPYPISDPAHEVASSFHALHRGLTEAEPGLRVASLHGTAQDGASVSDGTTFAGDAGSPAGRLTLALVSAFPAEPVTTCNAFPGATHEVRLCGTTNVQGRHLNGSPEACGSAASVGGGRFVHLEQSRSLRDRGARVIEALVASVD